MWKITNLAFCPTSKSQKRNVVKILRSLNIQQLFTYAVFIVEKAERGDNLKTKMYGRRKLSAYLDSKTLPYHSGKTEAKLQFTTLARLQKRLQADSIKISRCVIVYIKANCKQFVQLRYSGQSEGGSKCLSSNEIFYVLPDCQEGKNADDIDEFLRKKTVDKRCNS